MNRAQLVTSIQQEFHLSRLLPSLTAGLVVGIFVVIYCVSFAALIFSGNLSEYLPTGIGFTLFTATVVGIVAALLSSFPATVATPQKSTVAVLALVASTIVSNMPATASTEETFLTVVAAIVLNSILSGIFFLALGWFELGELIRFIPYPVIGGFLAGSGWLLVKGSIRLMTGLSLEWGQLSELFSPELLINWLPGLLFALLLLLVLQRYRHFLIMPGMVLGAIAIFYLVLLLSDTSVAQANTSGLLLGSFPQGGMWQGLSLSTVTQANWSVIGGQIPNLATIWLIDAIALLLNANGMELVAQRDINLNHELKMAGVATFASGLGGGIGGFHSLSLSALAQNLGASSRLVGLFAAGVCGVMLMLGASMLSFFPKPIVGGMLMFLGLGFLWEWIYLAWFKLPLADYCLVILILLIIATVGFLPGVSVGIIAAVILFVINYSQISVTKHIFSGANHQSHVQRPQNQERLLRTNGDQIYILQLQGLIFFGTANKLLKQIRQRLRDSEHEPVGFVLMDFRLVSGLDSSAVLSFLKLKQIASKEQIRLVFTNLSPRDSKQLSSSGCLASQDNLCQIFPDFDRGLEWCENQLLEASRLRRRRFMPLAMQLKSLFSNPEQVSAFMSYLEKVQISEGEYLFCQGDAAEALYFVESGQVSTSVELTDGQTRRVQTLSAGTIIGEIEFFIKSPYQTCGVADKSTKLYRLDCDSWLKMQQEHPQAALAFSELVMSHIGNQLTCARQEINLLLV